MKHEQTTASETAAATLTETPDRREACGGGRTGQAVTKRVARFRTSKRPDDRRPLHRSASVKELQLDGVT